MKDLVEFVAKKLVANPEAVQVNEIAGEKTSVLELRVAPDDLGKVIGKGGRTAKALRTVISAASVRENKRVILEILN